MSPRVLRRIIWDSSVAALAMVAFIVCSGHTEDGCDDPSMFFRCHESEGVKCVPVSFVCDGESDCYEGSDEKSCDQSHQYHQRESCSDEHQFTCQDGQCIQKSWVCDGTKDCPDDSDEAPELCEKKNLCSGVECKPENKCVHKNQTCDGNIDCSDGSDEIECSSWIPFSSECATPNGLFACADERRCLELSQVCDRKIDCLDGSDEGNSCNERACDLTCSHVCQPFPHGPQCICPKGSTMRIDGSCIDIDECQSEEHYAYCDQICTNHANGYTCSCKYGYTRVNNTCKAEGEASMLVVTGDEVRIMYFQSQVYDIIAKDLANPMVVTFDGLHVYWATIKEGFEAIYRSTEVGTSVEQLFTAGLFAMEDLAVDWITKNIYFTDSSAQHIAACSGDGTKCAVLISENLDKPRALVLHSTQGEMYFTDWGKNPKISKASMDGTNVVDIVNEKITWPNGLAIDFATERLYWADGSTNTVEYSNLDGSNRRKVNNIPLLHPYTIDIFEDTIYWIDLKENYEIRSCNKLTGKNCKPALRHPKHSILNFHIYHPLLLGEETENPCQKSDCSDLCLLAAKSESSKDLHYTCACPAGKELSTNKHTCTKTERTQFLIAGSGHQLYLVFPQPMGRFEIQEIVNHKVTNIGGLAFDPLGGNLIIADKTTNTVTLYDYVSREVKTSFHLPALSEITGIDFDYFGNNLFWIDAKKKSAGLVSLGNFERTSLINDFGGDTPVSISLVPEEGIMFIALQSNDSSIHIDQFSMDGSMASRVRRVSDHFVGPTISLSFDAHTHRLFWSDIGSGDIKSLAVDDSNVHVLTTVEYSSVLSVASVGNDVFWTQMHSNQLFWTRKSNPQSIKRTVVGELTTDHPMRIVTASEEHPAENHCHTNLGSCTHICLYIHGNTVCMCPEGLTLASDGLSCILKKHCEADEFMCSNNHCIPMHLKCDTKEDCPSGEDEHSCTSYTCPLGTFACKNGLQCISSHLTCDSSRDCNDGSDEWDCSTTRTCSPNEFQCSSGDCVHIAWKCDDKTDCPDGSDELDCHSHTCSADQFRCASGTCIPSNWECDGDADCPDSSDEHSKCNFTKSCLSHELQCRNGRCVDKTLVCNGEDDCEDGTDELDCKKQQITPAEGQSVQRCSSDEFTCQSNNSCLPSSLRCDGKADCPLGEDEKGCDGCGLDEFQCTSNRQCIPNKWKCDGVSDCTDHSDEKDCTEKVKIFHKTDDNCHGIRCKDTGLCVEWKNVCNNVTDCVDGSDEGGQCGKSCQNSGCEECHETPLGYHCACPKGYRLLSDGQKCYDIDECALPNSCSQFCQNTVGSFRCTCREEFYHLRSDRASCKAKGSDMEYVFATNTEIRFKSKSLMRVDLAFKSSRHHLVKGMDIDMNSKVVYWSSELNGALYKSPMDSSSEAQMIKGIIKPGKVAFDWVSHLVYFTEKDRFIRACDLTLKKCSTIYDCHHDVTIDALRIDALSRKLYWSETSTLGSQDFKAVVKVSDMSGANVVRLLDGGHKKITDIAVDDLQKAVYVIDSSSGSVQKIDLESPAAWSLIFSVEGKPTDINLFEGGAYWLNKVKSGGPTVSLGRNNVITKCGISGPAYRECEFISLLPDYSSEMVQRLRISHPALQPSGVNRCTSDGTSCTHMCISDVNEPVCICEDGTRVKKGQQCPPALETLTNYEFSTLTEEVLLHRQEASSSLGFWCLLLVLMTFSGLLAFAAYYYVQNKNVKRNLDAVHFQNPTYEMGGCDKKPIYDPVCMVSPGQHQYENPISFQPPNGIANNTMTISRGDSGIGELIESGLEEEYNVMYNPDSFA